MTNAEQPMSTAPPSAAAPGGVVRPVPPIRHAGSVPLPRRPVGAVNEEMPFDHVIVVMRENHSFDNVFGDLGRTRSDVDALSFDASGSRDQQ